ncbi:hypothetical protein BKH43_00165 [Helicobacter sp. 13S00401-1]|uniref:hypothetical protein n=1 Tax=Helicobacter sp. 13S00401-1 TaxID=1905758 RepID=UPI000BA69AF1|nr:hypothetical protein [Helicobacter sp. 13S00401-1]PAF51692.1 hypothetical protein BKH43_00165 [Helicobacter sp. 13S00401-1]
MIKSTLKYGVIVTVALVASGCATISNGTKQKVAITTSTGEQVVATIGSKKVTLPATVDLSRKKGAEIKVLHADNACYKDTSLNIAGKNKMSGWFWGNIIGVSGSTLGSSTDASSGGMWAYTNPNFTVPVQKIEGCKIESTPMAPTKDSSTKQDSK